MKRYTCIADPTGYPLHRVRSRGDWVKADGAIARITQLEAALKTAEAERDTLKAVLAVVKSAALSLQARLDDHFGGNIGPGYDWIEQEHMRSLLTPTPEALAVVDEECISMGAEDEYWGTPLTSYETSLQVTGVTVVVLPRNGGE